MSLPIYYAIPLLCAAMYGVGALMAKRALQSGFGVMRYVFLSNIMMALVFLPVAFAIDEPIDLSKLGAPLFCSLTFFLGQGLTFLAIRIGDVSAQAPVMGTKALFVAILSVFLGAGPVPLNWWIGAALTAGAIFLISYVPIQTRRSTLTALALSIGSAASFATTDVVLQREAPAFGPSAFIVIVMTGVGLLSFLLIPFFRGSLRSLPATAWKWGLAGSSILAIQSLGIAYTIGFHGHATAVNILYGSRGLWTVIAVIAAARFLTSHSTEGNPAVMRRRILGSLLMCVAIALVLAG